MHSRSGTGPSSRVLAERRFNGPGDRAAGRASGAAASRRATSAPPSLPPSQTLPAADLGANAARRPRRPLLQAVENPHPSALVARLTRLVVPAENPELAQALLP